MAQFKRENQETIRIQVKFTGAAASFIIRAQSELEFDDPHQVLRYFFTKGKDAYLRERALIEKMATQGMKDVKP